ncbi:MAG TPA: hypothetical protein GXX14_13620 [Clostridiaceae bacterium]|nr:hypothetical protein [Clostridiaceae bacterium]
MSGYENIYGRQMYYPQQANSQMPTGIPTGPSSAPVTPSAPAGVPAPSAAQVPTTVQSTMYIPGFLRTQIGRMIRVEFLIGTNGPLVDRTGTLLAVGASYILLRPINSDDILLCDIYSIKFVTIIL